MKKIIATALIASLAASGAMAGGKNAATPDAYVDNKDPFAVVPASSSAPSPALALIPMLIIPALGGTSSKCTTTVGKTC